MAKDPWWLFAYWEIQPSTERVARSQLLPHEIAGLRMILRVYDVTGVRSPEQARRTWDIPLSDLATSWRIPVSVPDRSWIVDIGILATSGHFMRLARSNRVTAPRGGPSGVVDPKWASRDEEFWELAGTVDIPRTLSSPEGSWGSHPRLAPGLSSASLGAHHASGERGFWCRVEAELVVYGATEPRATVQIEGQPVPVRPDGTFNVRLALPPGTQAVTVKVRSADGRHTKTVTPLITRLPDPAPRSTRPSATAAGPSEAAS